MAEILFISGAMLQTVGASNEIAGERGAPPPAQELILAPSQPDCHQLGSVHLCKSQGWGTRCHGFNKIPQATLQTVQCFWGHIQILRTLGVIFALESTSPIVLCSARGFAKLLRGVKVLNPGTRWGVQTTLREERKKTHVSERFPKSL